MRDIFSPGNKSVGSNRTSLKHLKQNILLTLQAYKLFMSYSDIDAHI